MSLLDQIAQANDLWDEEVEVPEWGLTMTLRTPTLAERSALLKAFVREDGTPLGTNDLGEMYVAVLTATCVDPETGARLFGPGDGDLLRSKNGQVVERIATVALRLCGMSGDAVPTGSAASS